ncbi:hypothetical protein ElyMa_001541400 [Elysia marginata]|uniref:MICOS complex subunit MIC25 n=1 Tax=Elysia marginata TaxID=1093978 RepID=A0AAV4JCR8_9GAST|nr:hypothetical protein ElyMa_001541400 [Elysia marginata]
MTLRRETQAWIATKMEALRELEETKKQNVWENIENYKPKCQMLLDVAGCSCSLAKFYLDCEKAANAAVAASFPRTTQTCLGSLAGSHENQPAEEEDTVKTTSCPQLESMKSGLKLGHFKQTFVSCFSRYLLVAQTFYGQV